MMGGKTTCLMARAFCRGIKPFVQTFACSIQINDEHIIMKGDNLKMFYVFKKTDGMVKYEQYMCWCAYHRILIKCQTTFARAMLCNNSGWIESISTYQVLITRLDQTCCSLEEFFASFQWNKCGPREGFRQVGVNDFKNLQYVI